MTTLEQNKSLGQSTWIDFIQRSMLESGALEDLIQKGVTGLTSNPTIFQKAITSSTDYDADLRHLYLMGKSPYEIFETLTVSDIRRACDLLASTYLSSKGKDGFASIEVRPSLAYDKDGTISEAIRLWKLVDRANAMIKVPATTQGIEALEVLISKQINVNVTLIFALSTYNNVMDAYINGLTKLVSAGIDISQVASVASFFVSRVDTAIDSYLGESSLIRGKAAIANAKLAYAAFEQKFNEDNFYALRQLNAQVQRPLWASTSTKNPNYSDTLYVDNLIGPNSVNTMPPETLAAVLDHGQSSLTINENLDDAANLFTEIEDGGLSITQVTDKLLEDGIAAFSQSFNDVLLGIQERCQEFTETS